MHSAEEPNRGGTTGTAASDGTSLEECFSSLPPPPPWSHPDNAKAQSEPCLLLGKFWDFLALPALQEFFDSEVLNQEVKASETVD